MNNSNLKIQTDRFLLQPINLNDANERYSKWLSNPITSQFISERPNLKELKEYVRKKNYTERHYIFSNLYN